MKISLKHVQIHFSEKSLKSVKKLFFFGGFGTSRVPIDTCEVPIGTLRVPIGTTLAYSFGFIYPTFCSSKSIF